MNTFKKKFVFTYHKIILIILLGVSSVSLGAGPVPEYYLGKINETEHFRNKYFEICSQFYFQHPMIFINLSFRKNLLLINFINFCIMFFLNYSILRTFSNYQGQRKNFSIKPPTRKVAHPVH